MTFLMNQCQKHLEELKQQLKGELKYDSVTRILFSTDASDYKELPCAVAWPRGTADLKKLLSFARAQKNILDYKSSRHIIGRTGCQLRYYSRYFKIYESHS